MNKLAWSLDSCACPSGTPVSRGEALSVSMDRPLLLVTIDIQARDRLSAYDAAYLALAETEDALLLTFDRQLSVAAGSRAIRIPGLGQERLSEPAAPYGEPVDWARFGPYLARLRADAQKIAGV